MKQALDQAFSRNAVDAAVKIGFLTLWLVWCFQIIQPFIVPVAWGVIIAIAAYPLYQWVVERLNGRDRLSAVVVTIGLLIILLAPSTLIGKLLIENIHSFSEALRNHEISIPPPRPDVETWPIIGHKLMAIWLLASENLDEAVQQLSPQIKAVGIWLLGVAKVAGIGFLQFFFAIVLAGILLTSAPAGKRVALNISQRLAGERGAEFTELSEQTIRSVANGVVGVAVIQAMFVGLGFYVVGVPAPGFWTFLCLLLGIVQIGVNPVTIPMMIYVFLNSDTTTGVLFIIWSMVVGMLDNILKPLLLGRGVKQPMAVTFVGAIGGLLLSGIIGLFLGAVILSLGYKLFQIWIESAEEGSDSDGSSADMAKAKEANPG